MSSIRRRNVAGSQHVSDSKTSRALDSLASFDVYTKVHDDALKKSNTGGYMTVIIGSLLAVLFWLEICEFCAVETLTSFTVDTRINQKVSITLNVSFPHLRCDEVNVDSLDAAGNKHFNQQAGLLKENLDMAGNVAPPEPVPKATDCLPCLEAEDEEHKCCNTCQALKTAYKAAERPYFHILDTAVQCKGIIGCRVSGNMVVNKVKGNIHVLYGESESIGGAMQVYEVNLDAAVDGFNTSHVIHSLAFGDQVPGMVAPLNGKTKIVRQGSWMYHYYIKLVPTRFTDRGGGDVYTNQYTYIDTEKNVVAHDGKLSGLPGVFLVYDFSAFLMKRTEKTKPWSYIFTSTCTIIGGVFSLASLVERGVTSFVFSMQPRRTPMPEMM